MEYLKRASHIEGKTNREEKTKWVAESKMNDKDERVTYTIKLQ